MRKIYVILLLAVLGAGVLRYGAEGRGVAAESGWPGAELFLKDDNDALQRHYLSETMLAAHPLWSLLLAESISPQFLSDPLNARADLERLLALPAEKLPPQARDVALRMLGDILYDSGDFAGARALFAQRGLVGRWFVCGSFGRYDRASFYEDFPPEAGVNLEAPVQSFRSAVQWRELPAQICLREFNPWDHVYPHRGTLYLYTELELAQEELAEFLVSTNCAFEVWIDGRHAGMADRFQSEKSLELVLREKTGQKLPAGRHGILFKLHHLSQDSFFQVRPVTPTGAPLAGVSFPERAQITPRNTTGSCEYTIIDRDAQRYAQMPEELSASEAARAGAYLQLRGMNDLAMRYWRQATELEPQNAVYWALRGVCERLCAFYPEARRESLARGSHLKALELAPECVPSLIALGEYERRNARFARAGEYYNRALAAAPGGLRALSARAKMEFDNGWAHEAEDSLAVLTKAHPQSFAHYMLNIARAEKNLDAAGAARTAGAMRETWLRQRGNLALALGAAQLFSTAGEHGKSLQMLEELPPELAGLAQSLRAQAQAFFRAQRFAEAAETCRRCSEILGGDPQALRMEGDIMLLTGKNDEALDLFTQSLALAPEQHELRRMVDELKQGVYEFWQQYMIDSAQELAKFLKGRQPAGRSARLIDQTVLTLYPDGSYANYTHQLQNVLNSGGVRDAATIQVYGELLQAKTILPQQGVELEPVVLPGQNSITMPAIAPGAVVEYAYLQTDGAPGDWNLRFPQWFFRSPDSEEAFLFSQYIIRVAPGTPFTYATRNLGRKVTFEKKTEEDGTEVYMWTGRDMPRAIHEEGTPAIGETLPYVAVGGERDWDGVNRLFLNYYTGRILATEELRQRVRQLTQNTADQREAAGNIFNFVCREIERTGAISPASYIIDQRSGDRVLLLLAMLRAAGMRADFVAARAPDSILFPALWQLPSSGLFSNFLVRLELEDGEALWLDPSFRFAGLGQITENIAGGTAFVTGQERGYFATLPPPSPQDYTTRQTREYSIDGQNLRITGQVVAPGGAGLELKEMLSGSAQTLQHNIAEGVILGGVPGFELEEFSLPGLEENGTPFVLDFRGLQADALRRRADGLRGCETGLPPLALLPQSDAARRQTPYHLSRYIAEKQHFRLNLPAGAGGVRLPRDLMIRNDFGYYQLTFRQLDDTVLIERDCHFPPQRIELAQWEDYRQMAQQIAAAERGIIWWEDQK